MWIECNASTFNSWSFGISRMNGQDETGEIEILSIGLILFSVDLIWNSNG
jgi:hypothetical protein